MTGYVWAIHKGGGEPAFPLHEKLKGHTTVSALRAMETSQWWTPDEIRAYQLSRLKLFLSDVAGSVPYYRELFKAEAFDPDALASLDDLARLPFLTKKLIRENSERLKSETAADLQQFNTGGSTGEPLIFFIGKERVSHDVAAKWRATRWWDVDIGDREIVVWGSPVELNAQDKLRAMRDGLLRSQLIPAFDMSEASLRAYIEKIRAFKPAMLFGYPSSLAFIARYAEKAGIRLDDLGVKVAFVTSERLYDEQREAIERVFSCPVANGYGGRDAGFIAHQCPEGNMHITSEDIIVEIVDASGRVLPPGELGEIVITHMATSDYPFIRYRTGDMGVLDDKSCDCGRGLPLLKEIQGRTTDFVVAEDGAVMHGLALIYILRQIEGIDTFKIVQESVTRTDVYLVVTDEFDQNTVQNIKTEMRQRLGGGVDIDISLVDRIPSEKSGKFRYIVSKVGIQ